MTFSIEVENKLETAQKGIIVRCKQLDEVIREEAVNFPEPGQVQSVLMDLESDGGADEYLEICIDGQQEEMGGCKIAAPSDMPYTFFPGAAGSLSVTPPEEGSNLMSLHIPSGLPTWKLELNQPLDFPRGDPNNVTVGEDEPGGNG
jgi:hypothetical protein